MAITPRIGDFIFISIQIGKHYDMQTEVYLDI
jgi:hypothetical protein